MQENAIYISGETDSYPGYYFKAFVAKFNLAGTILWYDLWDDTDHDRGQRLVGDGTCVYMAIAMWNAAQARMGDGFVAKYDASGNCVKNYSLSTTGIEYFYGVAVSGNYMYACGYQCSPGLSETDAVLVKFDRTTGTEIYRRLLGDSSTYNDGWENIVVNGSYLYLTGYTRSYGKQGALNILFAIYDLSGNCIGMDSYGGASDDYGYDLAVDGDRVYLCGFFSGTTRDVIVSSIPVYTFFQNWIVPWGGTADDRGECVVKLREHVYVAGKTASFGRTSNDATLIKYDTLGNKVWNVSWGGSADEVLYGLATDGDYMYIAGRTTSYGVGGDVFVVKYDLAGGKVWEKTWGRSGEDFAYSIVAYRDYLYVSGYTSSFGDNNQALILKLAKDSTEIWNRTWGGAQDEFGYDITASAGYIYIACSSTSYGATSDGVVLKYDVNGNLAWAKKWQDISAGYPTDDYLYGIIVDDNNIYAAGRTAKAGNTDVDCLLVKLDLASSIIWNRTWGGTGIDVFDELDIDRGRIFVAGSTTSYGNGIYDVFIAEYNTAGNFLNYRSWGGGSEDCGISIDMVDETVYVAGRTSSIGGGLSDFLLMRYLFPSNWYYKWEYTYGGSGTDLGWSNTIYNGFVYTVGTINDHVGNDDAFIAKHDLNGNLIWAKTWDGGKTWAWGADVGATSGYIYMIGTVYDGTSYQAYIAKFDTAGNNLANYYYGSSSYHEHAYGMDIEGTDIYICGDTNEYAGDTGTYFVKFSITAGTFGPPCAWNVAGSDYAYEIDVKGTDVYFAWTGNSNDAYIVKVVPASPWSYVWYQRVSTAADDLAFDVAVMGDYVYLTGFTGANSDAFVDKFRCSDGLSIWNRTWNSAGTNNDQSRAIATDGEYIYLAGSMNYGTASADIAILKYDQMGNLVKTITRSDTGAQYLNDIAVYNDYIYVTGVTNKAGTDTIFTGMYDSNLIPELTYPRNITVNANGLATYATWTMMDGYATSRTYNIYRNGTQIETNTWSSNPPIFTKSIDVSGYPIGVNNLTIKSYDIAGSYTDDTIIVKILNNPPTITHPADMTYAFGAPGKQIAWTISDLSTLDRSYTIKIDGGSPITGSWSNDIAFAFNIPTLLVGSHNISIKPTDGYGGFVQDDVNVTVTNIPPTITSSGNLNYLYGSSGHMISWTITDTSIATATCALYKDNISQGTPTNWSSGIPIPPVNVDGLMVGTHNYTIIAWDGYGGEVSNTIWVSVYNIPPVIVNSTDIVIYQFNNPGHQISWIITDASKLTGSTYTIYQNESTVVGSGTWASGNNISISVDGQPIGWHNYTIIANDGVYGITQNTIWVNVVNDVTPPNITLVYPVGNPYVKGGSVIVFDFFDFNRVASAWFNWDGMGNITLPFPYNIVAPATQGIHLLYVYANDSVGNVANMNYLFYTDNTPPVITLLSPLNNNTYPAGTPISLQVIDNYNVNQVRYSWYPSPSGVLIAPYSLTLINRNGRNLLQVTAFDRANNSITETFVFNVSDASFPVVSSPPDIFLVSGVTYSRYPINWTITESGSSTTRHYIVYWEKMILYSGDWTSGVSMEFEISGVINQNSSLFIIAENDAGTAIDEVQIHIMRTTHRIIRPDDIMMYEHTYGNILRWHVLNYVIVNPHYTIYRDGLVCASGRWHPSYPISLNLDSLAIGVYLLKIVASDDFGGVIEDEAVVTVLENLAPVIYPGENQVFGIDTSGHAVMWTIMDKSTSNTMYRMYSNEREIDTGAWTSGTTMVRCIDDLDVGTYNYMLIVDDGTGLLCQSSILVTVTNATNFAPVVQILNATLEISEGQQYLVVFKVRDVLLKNGWFDMFFDGNQVSIGNRSFNVFEPLEFGYTSRILVNSWHSGSKIAVASIVNQPGDYELVLVFHDGYGSFTRVAVKVHVSISAGKIGGVILIGCMIGLGAFVGVLTILYVVRPRETKAFLNKTFGRYKILEKLSRKATKKQKINILEEDKTSSESEKLDNAEPDKSKKDEIEPKTNKL
nr:hypothetical protein [Candidatus Sigynarchaeota archaeon]